MGYRIDYKVYKFKKHELTEQGYIDLTNKLKTGKTLIGNAIPKVSFFQSEKENFRAIGLAVGLMLLSGLLILIFQPQKDSSVLISIICSAPALVGFLGFWVIGLGLIFSLISYSSYSAKREAYLFRMKGDLLKSKNYADYCEIRNIEGNYSTEITDDIIQTMAEMFKDQREIK